MPVESNTTKKYNMQDLNDQQVERAHANINNAAELNIIMTFSTSLQIHQRFRTNRRYNTHDNFFFHEAVNKVMKIMKWVSTKRRKKKHPKNANSL